MSTSWLIPCSPDIYDAEGAFAEYGAVVWHQQCNMAAGDIAYIYVTAPVKAIRCKCLITMPDLPFDIGNDDGYTLDEAFCSKAYRRYMVFTSRLRSAPWALIVIVISFLPTSPYTGEALKMMLT